MKPMRIFLDLLCRRGTLTLAVLFFVFTFAGQMLTAQSPWSALGPAGGDARTFAAVPGHPDHLYLGSTGNWIYESKDGGVSWHRLAKLDPEDGLVLDHIIVDPINPTTVYVAAWRTNRIGGGLWISHDGGKSWNVVGGLREQSIRSFAQATSNPKMLFAGSLDGVFRSTDGGATWALISPRGSQEIDDIESLAIDPVDPNIVYAGTWHLPWKTTDGGKNWKKIKQGVIDDSDVFSIIIDPVKPLTVFASACSGIYKSENGGDLFQKVQGIPKTARRTRVLKQDPMNHDVVYAGTTEGLYKTVDGGKNFSLTTVPDVIVNDVFIDPSNSNHVLLATDRSGVLSSQNGGKSFVAVNEGFSGRKVEALLVDRTNPALWFAGVVNDKNYGGVFISTNAGTSWKQTSTGLDGRDVFALAQAADGTVLAGTSHGIFALTADKPDYRQVWQPRNRVASGSVKTTSNTRHGKRVSVEKQTRTSMTGLDGRVNSLDLSGDAWVVATSGSLYTSRNQGASWQGESGIGRIGYLSVAAHGAQMAAARIDGVVVSNNAGATWQSVRIPEVLTRVRSVAFSADGTLWLGAREGVFFTQDLGKTWMSLERIPFRDVDDVFYDARLGKVLASSRLSDQICVIDPKTQNWKFWRTGYRLRLIRATGDRMVAASLDDGVLVEPRIAEAELRQK